MIDCKLKFISDATVISLRLFITFTLTLLISNSVAGESYPSLWNSKDEKLQIRLEAMVKEKALMPHVDAGRLSLVLVDISDGYHPRLAELGGDMMVYAASLPKIAILLSAFVQIEQGKLKLDEKLHKDLTDMIRFSSNAAATRVLDRVGREELLEIIQSFKFRLYDPEHGGGLWVGKDYAKKGVFFLVAPNLFFSAASCWLPQSSHC
ncbi:MAG: hypothetical protein U9N50_07380 [Pseudomonadota bacterium]|nr:hypothetical protein [Pseudomonadota bacterium]